MLHANLATYVSSGADKFPWWRHSSSWYLKRRIIQHNQSQGRYAKDAGLAMLARCVLDPPSNKNDAALVSAAAAKLKAAADGGDVAYAQAEQKRQQALGGGGSSYL